MGEPRRLQVVVPGRPVPFARALSKGARRFDEPKYAAWKEAAGWHLKRARLEAGLPLFEGPVWLSIVVEGGQVEVHVLEVEARRPKGIRGDLDNYVKALLDAGNGTLFHDDSQVVMLHASLTDVEAEVVDASA